MVSSSRHSEVKIPFILGRLTGRDYELLKKHESTWLTKGLPEFLRGHGHVTWFGERCSAANCTKCLQKLKKLANGLGAVHPATGEVFHGGKHLKLHDDVDDIIGVASDWLSERGKDTSHGWLLHHPLKKLQLYQRHLVTEGKPERLVSKGLATALLARKPSAAIGRWRLQSKRPAEFLHMTPESRKKMMKRSSSSLDVCPEDSYSNVAMGVSRQMGASPNQRSPNSPLGSPGLSPKLSAVSPARTNASASSGASFCSAGSQPRRCFLSRSCLKTPWGNIFVGHCNRGTTLLSARGGVIHVSEAVHYPEAEEQLTWVCTSSASLLVSSTHRVVVVRGQDNHHETCSAGTLRVDDPVVLSGDRVEAVVMTATFRTRACISQLTFCPDDPVTVEVFPGDNILSKGHKNQTVRRSRPGSGGPRPPALMEFLEQFSESQLSQAAPDVYED